MFIEPSEVLTIIANLFPVYSSDTNYCRGYTTYSLCTAVIPTTVDATQVKNYTKYNIQ